MTTFDEFIAATNSKQILDEIARHNDLPSLEKAVKAIASPEQTIRHAGAWIREDSDGDMGCLDKGLTAEARKELQGEGFELYTGIEVTPCPEEFFTRILEKTHMPLTRFEMDNGGSVLVPCFDTPTQETSQQWGAL